jgi:hypothetical protein
MACTLSTYTGAQLLALVGGIPLGRVGIVEIDNDIANVGDHSRMAVAKTNFETWADAVGIDLAGSTLSATQCSSFTLALKWYALFLYQRWDIELRSKVECSEDDYRRAAFLEKNVRLSLKNIGTYATAMIQQFNNSLDDEAGVSPVPIDVTDLVNCAIVTDTERAANVDDVDVLFSDHKIKYDD